MILNFLIVARARGAYVCGELCVYVLGDVVMYGKVLSDVCGCVWEVVLKMMELVCAAAERASANAIRRARDVMDWVFGKWVSEYLWMVLLMNFGVVK